MHTILEFLVRKRPVSLQTRRSENLRAWKAFVKASAQPLWSSNPIVDTPLRFSLVYLCDDSPADIDNIIKPIQDALVGFVYVDDSLISDVDSHRRALSEPLDVTKLPKLLQQGVLAGAECVYVRVSRAGTLEEYL